MGKEIVGSEAAFEELKVYTDKYYSNFLNKDGQAAVEEAYRQLLDRGVRLRQDDGVNPTLTFSVPEAGDVLIVGIRYKKDSGRSSEDHFIFRPNENIYRCKGKELDRIYPEYKGSHILQLDD